MIEKLLTIVIPCKNEGKTLLDCLFYLEKQEGIKGTRVLVCDSSTDDTPDLLRSENFENINVEILPGGFPSKARNIGFSSCKTPYVLFLDSDIFLKDYSTISKCVLSLEYRDLVTIRVRTDVKYNWILILFDCIRYLSSFKNPFALGGFQLWKSEKFISLGGFDEEILVAEDYQLSKKVDPRKFKVVHKKAYTSPRRFVSKGSFYMIKLLIQCWVNKNNIDFFKSDHGYWKKD
jgi:glycosyltransferase involved in cell wall biosynthesis